MISEPLSENELDFLAAARAADEELKVPLRPLLRMPAPGGRE
jgi:hypothetical protein